MKIYFKEAISNDEFDFISDNFDGVEYIQEESYDGDFIYKEVMFETQKDYFSEKEWKIVDWFLVDGYDLYWDRLELKYYLK